MGKGLHLWPSWYWLEACFLQLHRLFFPLRNLTEKNLYFNLQDWNRTASKWKHLAIGSINYLATVSNATKVLLINESNYIINLNLRLLPLRYFHLAISFDVSHGIHFSRRFSNFMSTSSIFNPPSNLRIASPIINEGSLPLHLKPFQCRLIVKYHDTSGGLIINARDICWNLEEDYGFL